MKSISEILRELRTKNGYTQQKVADALGLENSSYGKKELGQVDITLSQLESIANFYKMSVLELLAYPSAVHIVGETLKPEIIISLKVVSENHAETIKEVLNKIEGIKLNN